MKSHSVIFIDSPRYERLEKPEVGNFLNKALVYFSINPRDLPKRIYSSFIPPVINVEFRKVYVDFVGPLIALFTLGVLLNYGHMNKRPTAAVDTSPTLALASYSLIMPAVCYSIAKLGQSNLDVAQIISLLGYALFGHVFTVATCYLIDKESSNFVFFLLMALFGGSAALRIVIILLMTIPKPVARLLVCSIVSTLHILFLVFIHFAYMHETFVYGKN